MPHRFWIFAPFLALALVTLAGVQLNSVDARGRVIDESTGLPVAGVAIEAGKTKGAVSGEDGSYEIRALPRDARLRTRMPGYQPATVTAETREIRLKPGALTVQVNEEGAGETRVKLPEARQGEKVLARGTESGQMVITTVDIFGQKALICAAGFDSKEIELRGVTLVMTLPKQVGGACPPLPTSAPAPTASPPTASPAASPSPSPTSR